MSGRTRVCSRCGQRRKASAFASPKARVCGRCKRSGARRAGRGLHLLQTYGITLAEYAALLAAQGGVCAGCKGRRRYNLHVDHDHKLEAQLIAEGHGPRAAARASVRGLLCARCNKVLRDVRDDATALASLVRYLRYPPARLVLGEAA